MHEWDEIALGVIGDNADLLASEITTFYQAKTLVRGHINETDTGEQMLDNIAESVFRKMQAHRQQTEEEKAAKARTKLEEHIATLNAGPHADEPICDNIEVWEELGVMTPAELDAWIKPPFRM